MARWIAERERRWEALSGGGQAYAPLPIAGGIDPFDDAGANRVLARHDLVYGAGIGLFGAPLFFLAERRASGQRDGATVIVAGAELARGIAAPPAASRGDAIVVRVDALRRWLWTRVELAHRGGEPLIAALRRYGDPSDAASVERMAEGEVETLILHELGERQAAQQLGADWEAMLAALDDRRSELLARALRDLLADGLVTLPTLAARRAEASLLFWRANFDGLRRELAPRLAAAFAGEQIDYAALEAATASGRVRWLEAARALLAAWHR